MDPRDLSPCIANTRSKYTAELRRRRAPLARSVVKLAEILLEVDRLKRAICKARQSLQRAHTTSCMYTFPSCDSPVSLTSHHRSLGHAVLNLRLERNRYENRRLGRLPYLFAVTGKMVQTGIVNMAKWLSTAGRLDDLMYYTLSAGFHQ